MSISRDQALLARDKAISKITTQSIIKYFDDEGSDNNEGINRLIDQINNQGESGICEAFQEFVDRPAINEQKEFYAIINDKGKPFDKAGLKGGFFTQFAICVLTNEIEKEFPITIDSKEATPFAAEKVKEIFGLLKEFVISPILKCLEHQSKEKSQDKIISKTKSKEEELKNFLEDIKVKLFIAVEHPTMFDLYSYLFYNPEKRLSQLLNAFAYKIEQKDAKQDALQPVARKVREVSSKERLEAVVELKRRIDKLTYRYNNEDSKSQNKYLSNYQKLINALNQYQSKGILSEDHCTFLKRVYEYNFGTKAKRIEESLKSEASSSKKTKHKPTLSLPFFKRNNDIKESQMPSSPRAGGSESSLTIEIKPLSGSYPISPTPTPAASPISGGSSSFVPLSPAPVSPVSSLPGGVPGSSSSPTPTSPVSAAEGSKYRRLPPLRPQSPSSMSGGEGIQEGRGGAPQEQKQFHSRHQSQPGLEGIEERYGRRIFREEYDGNFMQKFNLIDDDTEEGVAIIKPSSSSRIG